VIVSVIDSLRAAVKPRLKVLKDGAKPALRETKSADSFVLQLGQYVQRGISCQGFSADLVIPGWLFFLFENRARPLFGRSEITGRGCEKVVDSFTASR